MDSGSLSFYGSAIGYEYTDIDVTRGRLTATCSISKDTLTSSYIDEGWLGTMTDNLTTVLLIGTSNGRYSVTLSLTVQACSAVALGGNESVEVEIECSVTNPDLLRPHAVAVFRNAETKVVYAVGAQTKVYRSPSALGHPPPESDRAEPKL